MSDRLEELSRVLDEKTVMRQKIEDRQEVRKEELMTELEKTLDSEFGVETGIADKEVKEAMDLLRKEEENIREQEVMNSLLYPLGTVMVEWKQRNWQVHKHKAVSGKRSVLQIFRKGDAVPVNTTWSRPEVGSLVLRSLKSDGTLGASVKTWSLSDDKNWYPEGVDPNIKLEKKS